MKMHLRCLLPILLPIQVVQGIAYWGRIGAAPKVTALEPANRLPGPVKEMRALVEGRQDVDEWMDAPRHAVPLPLDCSDASLSTWTDRCDVLADSSTKRSETAAAFTVCEIRSTMSVPRECEDWAGNTGSVGRCIEAFSRSPQLWSSYTSLLRDVVHTCWATRSWHDSSAIRDLYRNISQNQHEHLRKVLLYEQHRYETYAKEAERREGWQNEADATVGNLKANAKDLSNVLDAYRELSKIISSVVQKQKEDATKQSLSMNDLTGALRETVVNLPSLFDEQARLHFDKMHTSMATALTQTTEQHALALSVGHGQALSKLEVGMIALFNEIVSASQGVFTHIDIAQNSAIALHETITSLHETLNATDEMAVKQHEMQKEALDLQGQLRQVMKDTRNLAIGGSLASIVVPILKIYPQFARLAAFCAGVALTVLYHPFTFNFDFAFLKTEPVIAPPWRSDTAKAFFSQA